MLPNPMDEKLVGQVIMIYVSLAIVFVSLICLLLFSSCTLSFQNISTNGRATDVVDQNQDADADIAPNINVPIRPL